MKLRAELEELSIEKLEIEEATQLFNYRVVVRGADQVTGRIPADKFESFMIDWIKTAQFTINKMRMRRSNSKELFRHLLPQIESKRILKGNLHCNDFTKLSIEIESLSNDYQFKTQMFQTLRRVNGQANLLFWWDKNRLQQLVEKGRSLKRSRTLMFEKLKRLIHEADRAEKEVSMLKTRLFHLKESIKNYSVPDVLDYVKLKEEVHRLKSSVKVVFRKINIQNVLKHSLKIKLTSLVGSEKAKIMFTKFLHGELRAPSSRSLNSPVNSMSVFAHSYSIH